MSDFTSDMRAPRLRNREAANRREYIAYFIVILIVALPFACITWTLMAARQMRMPEKSPLRTAWSEASVITSMILSA